MNPHLKVLIDLQNNLTQQARITRQLENPETLKAIAGEYTAVKKAKEEAENALEIAQSACKALEAEAAEKRGQIAALRQQMQLVRNQKEYSAILNSIDQIQRGLAQMEEVLKEKRAVEETQRKALEEILPRWSDLADRWAALEKEWLGQKQILEEKLEGLRHEQKFLERDLPESLRTLFWKIHKLRQGLAVVPVVQQEQPRGRFCSGCHIILRPQQYADVAAAKEIIRCDQCQRILYV